MGTFKVRFFGRFVFAEPVTVEDQGTGELNVLAANMQYNGDVASDSHGFVMTAERAHVSVPGTRRPDVMLMSAADPRDAELCLWDLRDHQVTIEGNKTFAWYQTPTEAAKAAANTYGKDMLPDLNELTGGEGRFQKLNLNTKGLYSPVHAVVQVRSGEGKTSQMQPGEKTDFVRFTHEGTGKKNREFADVVEIVIDQGEKNTLSFHLENRNGGPSGTIVVTAHNDPDLTGKIPETIVNFSNLCSTPHREFDHEFAGFYEVLENPSSLRERLIPRQPANEGWEFDCFKPAYINYRVG